MLIIGQAWSAYSFIREWWLYHTAPLRLTVGGTLSILTHSSAIILFVRERDIYWHNEAYLSTSHNVQSMLLYRQLRQSTLLLQSLVQQHSKSQHSSSDDPVHLGHVSALRELAPSPLRFHHDTRPLVKFRLIQLHFESTATDGLGDAGSSACRWLPFLEVSFVSCLIEAITATTTSLDHCSTQHPHTHTHTHTSIVF